MLSGITNILKDVLQEFSPEASDKLTANNIYHGIVTKVNPYRGLLDVAVGHVGTLTDCLYAPGAVASLLGVSSTALPPVGASVLLAYTGQTGSWVIGTAAGSTKLPETATTGTITGDAEVDVFKMKQFEDSTPPDEGIRSAGYEAPKNLLPGEQEFNTGTGVVMRLLFGLAQLNAGDLAKVEVHLLNDMVRIVDNYFVHHSCGGDELIWSAGRPTKEVHFTSYDYEADGKANPDEALAQVQGGVVDFKPLEKTASEATGRWRLSEYYGFLGDMVHRFVTSPTEVASNIMENSFRAGQYRSWVGSDGTMLIQAAGGVHVEVTQYIVIPSILKQWNSPDFDCEKAMKDLDKEFLAVWGEGPEWDDLKYACWQMRYYIKYISLYHSLARFHQMAKKDYCKIPTEKESPERKATADQPDVTSAARSAACRNKGHALFVMDPAGSVSLISNGNTSVIMNQGNIQIACPGNLEFKVGGTIAMTGDNVSIQGARKVEVLSLFGSLYLKARTCWQALCEAGTLWLKGDAKDDGSSAQDADNKYPDGWEDKEEVKGGAYAVVIDASQGKTLVHGAKGAVLGATDKEAQVYVQATGVDADVTIYGNRNILLRATKNLITSGLNFFCFSTKAYFASALVKIGENFALQGGLLACNSIRTQILSSRSVIRGIGKNVSDEEIKDLPDPKEIIDSEMGTELSAEAKEEQKVVFDRSLYQADYKQEQFINNNWELPNWKDVVSKELTAYNSLKASPLDGMAKNMEAYFNEFKISDSSLMSAPRTAPKNLPYPGEGAEMFEFSEGQDKNLTEPWDKQFTEQDIGTQKKMKPTSYAVYFTKKGKNPNEPLFKNQ